MTSSRPGSLLWNTTLSLVLNLTVRATGAVIFIAIGRLGSVQDAGTFSLALGYLTILTSLFIGLDDLLVREAAQALDYTKPILVTYGLIRFVLSIAAWVVLISVLVAFSFYSTSYLMALAILTISIVIDAFSALGQSVLNAKGYFGWPLTATVAGSAVRIALALTALLKSQDLGSLFLAWPIGSILTAVIMSSALIRKIGNTNHSAYFDYKLAKHLLRFFPAFFASGMLVGLDFQVDILMLSVLRSNEEVAFFSAAFTITLIVQMVSQAYRMVLYPAMVRSLNTWPTASRKLVVNSLLLMAGLSLPAAIVVSLISPELVNLIYGSRFVSSGIILQILIWNVVFLFLNVPLVRLMMAADGQNTVWQTLSAVLVFHVLIDLILIPILGAIGASYARLFSSGLFCIVLGWFVFRRLNKSAPTPHVYEHTSLSQIN